MYRLHSYMQGLRAQELRQKTLSLHRDIAMMKSLLVSKSASNEGHLFGNNIDSELPAKFESAEINIFPSNEPNDPKFLGDHDILGTKPHLNKAKLSSRDDLQIWNFISRSLYSTEQANPKKKVDSSMREGLNDIVTEVMDHINNFSRQRGRVIEFRELLYGYSRVNALYGHDLILDLLLIYKKYRGKKMTVPVRRHLYLQRAFTDCFVREMFNNSNAFDNADDAKMTSELHQIVIVSVESFFNLIVFFVSDLTNFTSMLSSKVRQMWDTSVERISDTLAMPLTTNKSSPSTNRRHFAVTQTKRAIATLPTIVFVLSLAGRFQTFLRFLANYEQTCLMHPELRTELLVVVFRDKNADLSPYFIEIEKLQRKYPPATLNHLTLYGNFSRGMALNNATHSPYIKPNDIIFFIDVDITFKRTSIERIRMNTILNRQVYLPIVFSQYNQYGAAFTLTPAPNQKQFDDAAFTNLDNDSGYFRQFGYGICAIFKADIMHPAINGFNTDIAGWGLEDVKFLEQLIKLNVNASQTLKNEGIGRNEAPVARALKNDLPPDKTQHYASTAATSTQAAPSSVPLISLAVFRAPDPSLVHVYHDINCDKNLSESQYSMCLGTKASTLGSYKYIESIFMNDRMISDFVTSNNKNS